MRCFTNVTFAALLTVSLFADMDAIACSYNPGSAFTKEDAKDLNPDEESAEHQADEYNLGYRYERQRSESWNLMNTFWAGYVGFLLPCISLPVGAVMLTMALMHPPHEDDDESFKKDDSAEDLTPYQQGISDGRRDFHPGEDIKETAACVGGIAAGVATLAAVVIGAGAGIYFATQGLRNSDASG